jgi:hypothetical protein
LLQCIGETVPIDTTARTSKKLADTVTRYLRRSRKFLRDRVLHTSDTPHRIALGMAIALFVAFTPTIGLQMFIAVAIAALFRANKAICIPIVWISNPITALPIYYFCWWIGMRLLPGADSTGWHVIMGRIVEAMSLSFWSNALTLEFWSSLGSFMLNLGVTLWVGCCFVGLVAGALGYVATHWAVTAYRRRRAERIIRRHERRRRKLLKHAPKGSRFHVRESA